MLVSIPPHLSVSQFMGYLKSKSSLMIFDRHANLKYKYGNRHFWCRGYFVDTVGKYETAIREYIENQRKDDIMTRLQVVGKNRANKKAPSKGAASKKMWLSNPLGAPFRGLPQEKGPYRACSNHPFNGWF